MLLFLMNFPSPTQHASVRQSIMMMKKNSHGIDLAQHHLMVHVELLVQILLVVMVMGKAILVTAAVIIVTLLLWVKMQKPMIGHRLLSQNGGLDLTRRLLGMSVLIMLEDIATELP